MKSVGRVNHFQRRATVMIGLDLSPQSRPDLAGLQLIKKGSGSRSTWAAYLKKEIQMQEIPKG